MNIKKTLSILILLSLTSCWQLENFSEPMLVHGPSLKKQKQKVSVLQKKLEKALREQEKLEEEVALLQTEILQAQLGVIRNKLDATERRMRPWQTEQPKDLQAEASTLFLAERELLHQIIQGGPSPEAFEAQVELDRILRLITELGDENSALFVPR